MKKRILAGILTVIFILTLLSFASCGKSADDTAADETTQEIFYYKVGEYKGKVAVFKNSDKTPFEIYESYIENFPEHDRELLRNGIKADTAEELQKIIEDYTS